MMRQEGHSLGGASEAIESALERALLNDVAVMVDVTIDAGETFNLVLIDRTGFEALSQKWCVH
jgi:hypothetical protein